MWGCPVCGYQTWASIEERIMTVVDKQDLVGKQLGDYLIKEKVATGGMSYVFLGEDVSLGRRAAVKVLTPDITEDDQSLPDRFKREARAVAQLEHDNIIPIYQFGELEGIYFLAMRFIEGHDFADEVNDAKREGKLMDMKRAIDVLAQVASALDYAHANGIVHRDIKPSNILIDNNSGKAILTDFGLVLWSSVDKTLGTAFGTPRYISPEQATDSQAAVAQSDIYSLAVIMYEMVTGKMLFTGQTPMEMAISHITEKPVPPRTHNANVPIQVEREILKALDKEPTNRHKTATEFIVAVQNAYEEAGGVTAVAENKGVVDADQQKKISNSTKPVNMLLDTWDEIPTKPQTPSTNRTQGNKIPSVKPRSITSIPTGKQKRSSRLIAFGGIAVVVLILGLFSIVFSRGIGAPPLPTKAVTDAVDPDLIETQTAEAEAAIAIDDDTPEPTDEPTPTDPPTDEPTATDAPTDEPTATDAPTDEPTITQTNTQTPTVTFTPTITQTATDYPILDELPAGVEVILFYNQTHFAIRNNSDSEVIFSEMRLSGASDNGAGEFDGATLPLVGLAPGECIVVRSENELAPAEWGCTRVRSSIQFDTTARFWFADNENDEDFRVFWRSNEIKTCPTYGRAVARLNVAPCEIEWPILADG